LISFLEEGFGDALVRAPMDPLLQTWDCGFRGSACGPRYPAKRSRAVPCSRRGNPFHLVKGAEDFFIGLHAQRAQEDGAEELALAVDAHVENVLGVVLEFPPTSRGTE